MLIIEQYQITNAGCWVGDQREKCLEGESPRNVRGKCFGWGMSEYLHLRHNTININSEFTLLSATKCTVLFDRGWAGSASE